MCLISALFVRRLLIGRAERAAYSSYPRLGLMPKLLIASMTSLEKMESLSQTLSRAASHDILGSTRCSCNALKAQSISEPRRLPASVRAGRPLRGRCRGPS